MTSADFNRIWARVIATQHPTGVLQTSPRLRKIQGAVDHFPRTTPVEAGQEFGQFIDIG